MVHFCEINFNLDQWVRRCHLKVFLIYNSGRPLNGRSRTICKILVGGIITNI